MNTPSTPAATPADAIGTMYSAWPAVTPSPRTGQLQTVGDVVDNGITERAQHRERPHVDNEVVVTEAESTLGQNDVRGCRFR